MKRFLTTGFLGAILGIVIGGAPADASLISRSFLDQALTDYATNTALDLKANKADLTDLSDKIGTLPSGEMNIPKGLASLVPSPAYTYPTTIGDSIFQLYSGTLGLSGLAEAVYYGNESMGQTDTARQVKGLRQITDEIGTLPSGPLIGNSPAMDELFRYTQNIDTPVFPNSLSDLINQLYGSNGMGAISALLHGFEGFGNEYGVPVGILPAMDLGFSATQIAKTAIATATEAKTAADANTAKIGTLPDGLTVANLYNDWTDSDGYGVLGLRILEAKNFVAYNPRTGKLNETTDPYMGGLLGMLYQLFSSNGYEIADEIIAPFWYLTKQALSVGEIPHEKTVAGMIDEINTKIGTVPSGNFPEFPGYDLVFPKLNQPLTYPTSLAELITAIYGNSETGGSGLLGYIIAGFPFDIDGDGKIDSNVGTLSNFMLARDASLRAEANTTKIGTLPAEYATVGAALTAMDAKIDARELPSTSADGQYVLTAKKVGETISYTWVKMDLTNEEQSQ